MTEPTPHYCDCGCGALTAVAARNNTQRGYVKGLSFRFTGRHHAWKGGQAGYDALHAALRLHFPKTGICQECGAGPGAATEYSLIHGREVSRDRDDYRELCRPCHRAYDAGGELSPNAKLTDAAVLDIRRRWDQGRGEPLAALAREYGVSVAAARRAATGKTWRHLKPETPVSTGSDGTITVS